MPTTIKFFDPSRLRQEEARTFHEMMSGLTAMCTHELATASQTHYVESLNAYKSALRPDSKSQVTSEITNLDTLRGQVFVSSRAYARTMAGHFNAEKAAVAQAAFDIYRKYGEVQTLPYLDESGCLDDLVEDLEELDNTNPDEAPSAQYNRLEYIGLREWVDEIKRVNEAFKVAFMKRLEEQSSTKSGLTVSTRKTVDSAYTDKIRNLNAIIELYGDEGMEEMVAQINDLIDYQNTVLKARHGSGGVTPDPSTPDEGTTPDEGGDTPDPTPTPDPDEGGGSDEGGGDTPPPTPTPDPTPDPGDDDEEVVG